MGKRFIVIALLVCFTFLTAQVYAEQGKMKVGHGDMEGKFYKKAMLIIANQEELGLTDAEVKKIKDLKIATKKDLITKKAEIDLIAIDIKAALWEDTVDINSVNALIDKKYELKKQKTKSLVAAYVTLKGTLTKEQTALLKGLCKKGKK
ncbi:Spy/CpxP family protein refolding chaperone [Candidatus Omnitrophota bacterium]